MKTTPTFFHFWILVAVQVVLLRAPTFGFAQTSGSPEWERIVAAAKKEGKFVAGIPASADLRKQIETTFKAKFPGIELELVPSRSARRSNFHAVT